MYAKNAIIYSRILIVSVECTAISVVSECLLKQFSTWNDFILPATFFKHFIARLLKCDHHLSDTVSIHIEHRFE